MISVVKCATSAAPLKVTHVIGSLDVGGAEQSLCSLVTSLDPAAVGSKIVDLIPGGALSTVLRKRGIAVNSLAMRPGWPDPRAVIQLARLLKRDRPDVLVTWMPHANVIGGLAARLAGGMPVVWSIRHNAHDSRRIKRLTRLVAAMGARLSRRLADRVVFVAAASRSRQIATGFDAEKTLVIPNGFDLAQFQPDPQASRRLHGELRIAADANLIGHIGRFHPDKDHRTFLHAAMLLRQRLPSVRFVLCGQNVEWDNATLASWIDEYRLRDAIHLLGRRNDIPRITAGLDLAVCSSVSEAFPRAVGEAMACGVPCVVTDVGDSAYLVGSTGKVVRPQDHVGLAHACFELLGEREPMGRAARQRMVDRFDIRDIAARHVDLWRELAANRRSA